MRADETTVNQIDQQSKDIVNGYIKLIQLLLPWKKSSHFIIPTCIKHLLIIYYAIPAVFNKIKCSSYLQFINDRTVKKVNCSWRMDEHSLVTFGEALSIERCNKFRIEYTLKQGQSGGVTEWYFMHIGFYIADEDQNFRTETLKCIKYTDLWNPFAWTKGNDNTLIICLRNDRVEYYGKAARQNRRDFTKKASIKFQTNDKLMFTHNFKTKKCTIYYNRKKIAVIIINEKYLLPVLSLYYFGEMVEITKYEFY